MDLRQLEHFIAVAAEQNFTRAAARLNIVQSGLSASIRALEEELGAALFIRTTRRVELTPTGRAFHAEARRVLAATASARQVVDEMQGLRRGILSVGMIQSTAHWLDIAELLGQFYAACPHVEIRLTSSGSLPLTKSVRNGELDLAFVYFTGPVPPGLSAWMLACEPLVAVFPPQHRFAGLSRIGIETLAGERFVDLNRERGVRQLVDQSFDAIHVTRHTALEVSDLHTQLDLVAHGLGIALMQKAIVEDYIARTPSKSVKVVELEEPEICWELAAIFAHDGNGKPYNAITQEFLKLLESTVHILEKSPS